MHPSMAMVWLEDADMAGWVKISGPVLPRPKLSHVPLVGFKDSNFSEST